VTHQRRPTIVTPFTTHPPPPQPQTRTLHWRPFISSPARPAPPPQQQQQQQPEPVRSISGEDWEKLSAAAKIEWQDDGKWGWVVYRVSYAKEFDGGWDDLKRRIQRARESLARGSDAPAIAKTMDFVFIEDPALEGASVAELQKRFQAWVRQDYTGAGDLDNPRGYRGARYDFFVKVDGEGLWNGYLGLVPGGWPDSSPGTEGGEWMKFPPSDLDYPEFYQEMDNPEMWYTPPWGCRVVCPNEDLDEEDD
jgi:hypothetical protein